MLKDDLKLMTEAVKKATEFINQYDNHDLSGRALKEYKKNIKYYIFRDVIKPILPLPIGHKIVYILSYFYFADFKYEDEVWFLSEVGDGYAVNSDEAVFGKRITLCTHKGKKGFAVDVFDDPKNQAFVAPEDIPDFCKVFGVTIKDGMIA